ncbi:MAG: hypothetical protein D6713_05005 [Deltaproteobacteria bacterium]|nr:MAG: hypothetical protein D6713_05005 [Deltaproteobacteria bacterium]
MAYFYDKRKTPSREEAGGFNIELLLEMRNALIDLEGTLKETKLNEDILDIVRMSRLFDFPDDEIG